MSLQHLTKSQVHQIINSALALKEAFPPSDEGINLADEQAVQQMIDYNTSAEHRALTAAILGLSTAARHELMALTWLGRGDDPDFQYLTDYARKNADTGDVEYIAEKASSLPTYLERGLALIHTQ